MNPLDPTEALALLLKDRQLRTRFSFDPTTVVAELGVPVDQAHLLLNLNVQHLHAQADSLIRKRCSEVSELLPQTWSRLGPKATALFRDYAEQSEWPKGHRRHLLDAENFCRYLRLESVDEYLSSEHHQIKFRAKGRLFSAQILRRPAGHGIRRWAVQILTRRNGSIANKTVHLGPLFREAKSTGVAAPSTQQPL